MPNKCGIVTCRGNYNLLSKRRIFKLPSLDPERQRWLAGLCAFLFMSPDFRECEMTVLVENKSTLCSPLTCFAYKSGVRVPLGTILNPNNGLSSYSQFYAVVHTCLNYKIPLDKVLMKVVTVLQAQETEDQN